MNVDGIHMGEYATISKEMIDILCVAFMAVIAIDINIYIIR